MGKESKAVKAALQGNNKLTNSEIRNLTAAGIGMDKILSVAGKQGATIGSAAQQAFNISQNKGTGLISYTPALTPGIGGMTAANGAYGLGGAATPKPGSGFVITGQQGYQTNDPSTGSTNNVAPTYTYMGAGAGSGAAVQSGSKGGASPYSGVAFNWGGGPNNIGPLRSGVGPLSYGVTTQGAGQDVPSGMQAWLDSLGIGIQTLTDSLNKQIAENQANQQSYMTTIDNLIGQMSAANQQMFSGPYAVTTQNSVPVMGAQTTQAINRRQKISNTSLSIRPETTSAGTGLNIAA